MPLLSEDALNDFFLPSQDCIKPVEVNKTQQDSSIKVDESGKHWEVAKDGTEHALETASITLNDCLACSGCVTTAESVLIGLQSWSEVAKVLAETGLPGDASTSRRAVVASISPQSIASIAASFGLSRDSTFCKLKTLLKSLGFSHVLSTNAGREVSLHHAAQEFLQRRKDKATGPLLAGACPGWICYAEKQKSSVLPSISRVRSPQQLTGRMLKDVLTRELSCTRAQIYHVAIMPCFDKKLEASRQEFAEEEVRDVDTVVTSAEVVDMIRESGCRFADLQEDISTFGPESGRAPGSSSGGYLAHILKEAARSLHGIELGALEDDPRIRITRQRSPKLTEYELLDVQGLTLLRFAEAYGFRQITSLTQKLAPKVQQRRQVKRVEYDYVEVMACESGCINGGGQVKPPAQFNNKDWVGVVQGLYVQEQTIETNAARVAAIERWWQGSETPMSQRQITTTFNEIPPLINPLASKW
jgi:iron only hydrogenase large subunit-like protein